MPQSQGPFGVEVSKGESAENEMAGRAVTSGGHRDAEEELRAALERIDKLEGLLEAMGVARGFGLEYVLRSICPGHALPALLRSHH